MSMCRISETCPTEQNFSRYKTALNSRAELIREQVLSAKAPVGLPPLGVELGKILALVGMCQLGEKISDDLVTRFIALEQITHKCLSRDEVESMSPEQVTFLIRLLKDEAKYRPAE